MLGKEKVSDEPAALEALWHFGEMAPKGFPLVPEHVETRPLYNPEKPGIDMVSFHSIVLNDNNNKNFTGTTGINLNIFRR